MSTMCKRNIIQAYRLFFSRTDINVPPLEEYAIAHGIRLEDKETFSSMSDQEVYASIFSAKCRRDVEEIFTSALRAMQKKSITESTNEILLLTFMQDAGAMGLWKYHLDVGDILEPFVREFDRLDMRSEQFRLHQWAQKLEK